MTDTRVVLPHANTWTGSAGRPGVQWSAYLFVAPAFAVLGVFHIFPVLYAVYVSLTKGPINRFTFVGADNYVRALTGAEFWNSLATTFTYALLTLPATMALGLLFAYLLFQTTRRGRGLLRVAYFLPYVISTVGSAIVWAWIFDPQSGLANQFLERLGLPALRWLIEPTGVFALAAGTVHWTLPGWLSGPSLSLVAVAIFSIWQTMGYDVVIFLAGLTNIPGEVYEAARIDGASGLQLFRHITVPLLAPTTFFVLVISVIFSLQAFNQIYAMNQAAAQTLGGPLGTTATLSVYMFDQLYTNANYGYASAIAILLSSIILGLTLFNFRVFAGPETP